MKRSASDMSKRRKDIMNDWNKADNDESQVGRRGSFETMLFD